jgi:hypothetical protein
MTHSASSASQSQQDQQLQAMQKQATEMWKDLRALTKAVQVNTRANPRWDLAAKTIAASSGKKSTELRGLAAHAEGLKEKLESRFGISHPSQQIESFCENTLSQIIVWKKKLDDQLE